ncbi:hypothetical protein AB0E63_46335 [Kribbella sp. NPDC026596]|uniref:hypothetical protein n=1 Tax=Kribbella sp. NPDC026596 TaxID=3155122 RepID=UPI0033F8A045
MDSFTAAITIAASVTSGAFALGGVWLSQRFQKRQRARDRAGAADAKIEETTRELLDAVSALQVALYESVPRSNSWQPKLTMFGLAFLEFVAGHRAGGVKQGMAQVGRVAVGHGDRDLAAVDRILVRLEQVLVATNRVAVLPDSEFRTAALRLSEAANAAMQAYGTDALWRPKAAKARRAKVDAELLDALGQLLTTVNDRLHPEPAPNPPRWWRRTTPWLSPRRRAAKKATAMTSAVPIEVRPA